MPASARLNAVPQDQDLPASDPEVIEGRLNYLLKKSETLDTEIMAVVDNLIIIQEKAMAPGGRLFDPGVLASIGVIRRDLAEREYEALEIATEIEILFQIQSDEDNALVDSLDQQFQDP